MCGGCRWLCRLWLLGSLLASRGRGELCVCRVLWLVFSLSVPLFTSGSEMSFLVMPGYGRTLWKWIVCGSNAFVYEFCY